MTNSRPNGVLPACRTVNRWRHGDHIERGVASAALVLLRMAAGLAGRTVEWRGLRLRLDRDGKILPDGGGAGGRIRPDGALQLLNAFDLGEVAVKGAQRHMSGLPGKMQHQTVREAQGRPRAEQIERRGHHVRVL